MDVTDKVGGVLHISPSGKSLLLALEDGTLQLRTFDGKAVSIAPHDTLRGGACTVTLELSGGYAVSSGLDGMVCLRSGPCGFYLREFKNHAETESAVSSRRASFSTPRSSRQLLRLPSPLCCR